MCVCCFFNHDVLGCPGCGKTSFLESLSLLPFQAGIPVMKTAMSCFMAV